MRSLRTLARRGSAAAGATARSHRKAALAAVSVTAASVLAVGLMITVGNHAHSGYATLHHARAAHLTGIAGNSDFGPVVNEGTGAPCLDSNENFTEWNGSEPWGQVYAGACNGGFNQDWNIIVQSDPTLGNTFLVITDAVSGLCLDSGPNGGVYALPCDENYNPDPTIYMPEPSYNQDTYQQWVPENCQNGYCQLIDQATGMALNVINPNDQPGSADTVTSSTSATSQFWSIPNTTG